MCLQYWVHQLDRAVADLLAAVPDGERTRAFEKLWECVPNPMKEFWDEDEWTRLEGASIAEHGLYLERRLETFTEGGDPDRRTYAYWIGNAEPIEWEV